ncbi:alpha-N-acetylgalactosaminidase [Fulvitalea axinellae]|uniref:Alpha-N-acetylgalactosaminidase n=2 Tax=Fulvitalea axinellae TaxID=1182444 RepID=A0AAU9CDW0_9BACT|nr:alpha-N-acetylgalactosaminidase [Fulvitalea axinellae]
MAGLGISMLPDFALSKQNDRKKGGKKAGKVRLGFIGVGLRGIQHLSNALKREDIVVPAVCDIDPARIKIAKEMLEKAGHNKTVFYAHRESAWEKMLKEVELDGVIISTPWLWHTVMCVTAMRAGVYAGVEVPATTTMAECWDLVNTYEETGVPCMMLENVCYRRDVMAVLNMVRHDVFGELVHGRCGYLYDMRYEKFNDGKQWYGGGVEFGEKAIAEARWRTQHSVHRNADIYPTHGIGPMAVMMNINRGNRFMSLTSVATKSRGLHEYVVKNGGADHPNAKVRFKLGDIVTSIIKTANGESIIVTHDTNLPRPYSLDFRVQGTRGLWEKDANKVYIDGESKPRKWDESEVWLKKYDHPLWKKYEEEAKKTTYGGMDFFVLHAFVESIKAQSDTPLDVYDAAAWCSITPLSERSIANNGEPQDFPDFTKGQWIKRKPVYPKQDEYFF